MVVFPNIKINLGLSVTSKRPDGYHNIESVFYPVGWHETLEVCERNQQSISYPGVQSTCEVGKVRFLTYGLPIPGDASSNLCIKVYQRLEEWFHLPEIDMHLLKTLPIGAGLGGGSADAAFALRALKEYFSLSISDAEAMEILASLGSDCPFFWKNRPMFVHGRGEHMRPIDLDLSQYFILLVNPKVHISTQEAYAGIRPTPPRIDLQLLADLSVEDWREAVVNDFEQSVFQRYPNLQSIKESLYSQGAAYASMTGSGSTLFGIFEEEPEIPSDYLDYTCWKGRLTLP